MAAIAADVDGPEDSDDDFQYEEVEILSDEEEVDKGSEDLDAAMRSLQAFTAAKPPAAQRGGGAGSQPLAAIAPGAVTRRPEVIDDFLRNFFVKMGLARTCEAFETEWYEMKATGRLEGTGHVPDVYLRNAELEEEVAGLRRQLSEAQGIAGKASATWDQFRKERDYHRMHHKRVAQLEALDASMGGSTLADLTRNLQSTATRLTSPSSTAAPAATLTGTGVLSATATAAAATTTHRTAAEATKRSGWSTITAPPRKHPYEEIEFPAMQPNGIALSKTFKGHLLSVVNLVHHPTKPILVTASDDKTWKMWHMPQGDLIMVGEGHKDWVAAVDIHPAGTGLASGGGDCTVKVWDFERQKCVATLTDHKQAVWSVKYHYGGDVLASSSLDHTVRLWDLPLAKCKLALRGHVDSVNDCAWQPFCSNLATASSDKTVSIWDARSGLCTTTFYGHHNSCNSVAFNLLGTVLASSDADGAVKLWDTRMVAEIMTLETGKLPANKMAFDRSGTVLNVACDDGKVRIYNTADGELMTELSGHEEAVQAVALDPAGRYMISAGSDNTFRLWA
ncbi:MAG: hypothetical protein WDW38_008884 [Sanguina aurantia]